MYITTKTPRSDLEIIIIENDVLPCNSSDDMQRIQEMTTGELYDAVVCWIESGNEVDCGGMF